MDAESSTLDYAWVQITAADDPTPVTEGASYVGALTNPTGTPAAGDDSADPAVPAGQSRATFTAPQLNAAPFQRAYFFQLTGGAVQTGVTLRATGSDIVTVTVTDATAPTVSAGPDAVVAEGISLPLAGRGSDSEGDSVNFAWTYTAQPTSAPALTLAATAAPTVAWPQIAEARGTIVYTLTLTATDSQDNAAADTVEITVHDTTAPTAAVANTELTVDTGAHGVRLDASGSRRAGFDATDPSAVDDDATGIAFLWEQVDGPASNTVATEDTVTLLDPDSADTLTAAESANPTFDAADDEATLWFKVTVTDTVTRAQRHRLGHHHHLDGRAVASGCAHRRCRAHCRREYGGDAGRHGGGRGRRYG